MRDSRVVTKLRKNQPVLFYLLHMTDASVWEMASLIGFDCLWLDMEHHAHSMETATRLFRSARVGSSDVIARPGKGEWMRMSRMLEAGAQGILYPRCQDAAEAREVVRWCKFAPIGERGADGGNPDAPYGSMDMAEYVHKANEQTFIIIQVEDEKATHEAESILAVDGVDGVMLGRVDFSVLSGFPGQFDHPNVQRSLDRLAQAATNTGKHWGSIVFDTETASQWIDAGARLMFTGADTLALKNVFEQIQRDWTPLGVQFSNQLGD